MCHSQIPFAYRSEDDVDESSLSSKELSARRRTQYPPAPEPLPVSVIDNHTHLNLRSHLAQVSASEAMDVAEAVGVGRAVQVAFDLESARFTREVVEADHRLLGAVAIHPNEAPELESRGELDDALRQIEEIARHSRVRALGETGLDYFRTSQEGLGAQEKSFREHIAIAEKLGKAIQIHDRDAHEDVVRILKDTTPTVPVVFHCFSGDRTLAQICNDHSWYMSFSGTVTFKNSSSLREALAEARRELMLVETDSPYLTPHPHRGQPNASYMMPATVRFMADQREKELEAFCFQLTENTERVYGSWDS